MIFSSVIMTIHKIRYRNLAISKYENDSSVVDFSLPSLA